MLLSLVFAGSAVALPAGSLDLSYGLGDGKVTSAGVNFGPGGMDAAADGTAYVATGSSPGGMSTGTAIVLRASADGSAMGQFATTPGRFNDVALLPDGKVVAVGFIGGEMLVAQFNSDGSPDMGFSGDGVYSSTDASEAVSVAPAPGGGFIVGGTKFGSPSDIVVKKFASDGSVPVSYSDDPGPSALLASLAVQADGKVVVVGRVHGTGGDDDWLVMRLSASLAPDPGFTVAPIDFGTTFDRARNVAIQPDGRIVVVGTTRPDNGPGQVLRFLTDGQPDPTFGTNGRIPVTPDPASPAIPGVTLVDVELDDQGRILVSGSRGLSAILLRLSPTGPADPSFVTGSAGGSDLEVLPNGKILASFGIGGPADPPPLPGESRGGTGLARILAEAAPDPKCGGKTATIIGTPGADRIKGTTRRDVIVGLAGNDQIKALGGNDVVCGSGGADIIFGGKGNDRLFGQGGADRLVGGKGKDKLRGGKGKNKQRP